MLSASAQVSLMQAVTVASSLAWSVLHTYRYDRLQCLRFWKVKIGKSTRWFRHAMLVSSDFLFRLLLTPPRKSAYYIGLSSCEPSRSPKIAVVLIASFFFVY